MNERTVGKGFGSVLKHHRKKAKLSLAELSSLTGISPSYLQRLECGSRRGPSLPLCKAIAEGLKIPLSDLLSIEESDAEKGRDISVFLMTGDYYIEGKPTEQKVKELLAKICEMTLSNNLNDIRNLGELVSIAEELQNELNKSA